MLAGGALGYGIGKSTARALDEWLSLSQPLDVKERAVQAAKDIGTGATYEMIGNKIIMLTESRFEKGTALKKDLTAVEGLQKHLNKDEHKRRVTL